MTRIGRERLANAEEKAGGRRFNRRGWNGTAPMKKKTLRGKESVFAQSRRCSNRELKNAWWVLNRIPGQWAIPPEKKGSAENNWA